MELIDPLAIGRHFSHEIIVLRQVDEKALRLRFARKRGRYPRGHSRETSDAQEELACGALEAIEDFAAEVVEDHLRRCIARQLADTPGEFRILEQQDQSSSPALGAFAELHS